MTNAEEETLDPSDWADVEALSQRVVGDAVGYLRDIRLRPAWREMPGEVRGFFSAPLPRQPMPLDQVYRDVAENLMPYPMGNIHPRFWGWYMGAGVQWRNVLPQWDLGVDGRYYDKLSRNRIQPGDPVAVIDRPRLHFDVEGVTVYLSRHF